MKKAKITFTEKMLTDKSIAIAEMGERLNALFGVLGETANTGMGKKI